MNIETANRLIELRKRKGLSQEELAEALGISRQAISKWERAESGPDVDNAILLSRLYNISLDELFGNKPEYERALDRMELSRESGEASESAAEGIGEIRSEGGSGEEYGSAEPEERAESMGDNVFTGVRRLILLARADVELTASGGDKCIVSIGGSKAECDKCTVYCEGDALHIETGDEQRHFFFAGIKNLHISVKLPNGMKSIEGKLMGGDIKIHGVEAELVKVKTGGGEIITDKCTAGELTLSTGGGDIELKSVNAKRAELTTGGGEIECAGVFCTGAFSAVTSGGDIKASGRAKCVAARSGGGDIKLSVTAEGFEVKSGGGDIFIWTYSARSISAKTGGGDIKVKLGKCAGISADLASMGGMAELIVSGERIASGKKIEATVGSGESRLEMRSGGGDITVEAE